MSINGTVLTSENLFILKSYVRTIHEPGHTLLQLEEDDTFSVTGKDSDFNNPAVNFYLNRTTTTGTENPRFILQFRPKEYPDKFITVSGEDVILQDADKITDLSNCFRVFNNSNEDYYLFQSMSSDIPKYLTADADGLVSVTEKPDFASWFHIVRTNERIEKDEESVLHSWDIEKITRVVVVEE